MITLRALRARPVLVPIRRPPVSASGAIPKAALVLFDGSPSHPDGNALWDLADEVGISVFGTSAKWISAIEKARGEIARAAKSPGSNVNCADIDTFLSTPALVT